MKYEKQFRDYNVGDVLETADGNVRIKISDTHACLLSTSDYIHSTCDCKDVEPASKMPSD